MQYRSSVGLCLFAQAELLVVGVPPRPRFAGEAEAPQWNTRLSVRRAQRITPSRAPENEGQSGGVGQKGGFGLNGG